MESPENAPLAQYGRSTPATASSHERLQHRKPAAQRSARDRPSSRQGHVTPCEIDRRSRPLVRSMSLATRSSLISCVAGRGAEKQRSGETRRSPERRPRRLPGNGPGTVRREAQRRWRPNPACRRTELFCIVDPLRTGGAQMSLGRTHPRGGARGVRARTSTRVFWALDNRTPVLYRPVMKLSPPLSRFVRELDFRPMEHPSCSFVGAMM